MGFVLKKGDIVTYTIPLLMECHKVHTGVITKILEKENKPFLEVLTLSKTTAGQEDLTSKHEKFEKFEFELVEIDASKVTAKLDFLNEYADSFFNDFESLYNSLLEFVIAIRYIKHKSGK